MARTIAFLPPARPAPIVIGLDAIEKRWGASITNVTLHLSLGCHDSSALLPNLLETR
jgi:hypothetical protein